MKCVLSRTSVPTPRPHRWFFTRPDEGPFECGYLVMDYVEGNTVRDVWKTTSEEKRVEMIDQVADIVSQLQTIHFEQPGPLGGGECIGMWFSDFGAGPFANKEEFNAWFTHKLEISKKVGWAKKDLPPFSYDSFVLVHQDIIPDNLMLDSSGRVWIIDWGCAGAYPPIFESAQLDGTRAFPDFDSLLLQRIHNDPTETEHLRNVSWGLTIGGFA